MTVSSTDISSLPRRERERLEAIQLAEYAKKLFEEWESEEGLVIDASGRRFCRYWVKNREGKKRRISSRFTYGSKANKIIIKGLVILGENRCFHEAMDKDNFKLLVEGTDRDIYRGDVNGLIKRPSSKDIFDINGKIKLKYPVKEVWT